MSITCSQLYRVALCRGSENLCNQVPKPPAGPAAEEGLMLHRVFSGEKPPATLTSDQQYCIDFCNAKMAELVTMVFGDKKPTVQNEVKFFRNGKYWGRCDALCHRGGVALIADPKFGRVPVEKANENWQIRGYIVGAKQEVFIQRAFGAIMQPRLEEQENRCTVVEYGPGDITQAEKEIDEVLKSAEDPDAPLTPSESACRYCAAKAICPAIKGVVNELVNVHSSELAAPVISDYLRKARIVKKVCESIEFHALQMDKAGVKIPGFKRKEGGKRRTVTDAGKAYEALSGTLTPDQFTSACKVQVGELERVYTEATGKKSREAKASLEQALIDAHCLEIKQGESTLVEE